MGENRYGNYENLAEITAKNIGEKIMNDITAEDAEHERGYLSPEFIREREAFYIDVSGRKVMLGCSDDREPTEASADKIAELHPDIVDIREGFASIYGAAAGIAKNAVIVGTVQYGPGFVERIGGFEGALHTVVKALEEDADTESIFPALHSAANNEAHDSEFHVESDQPLGCAYAGGIGATSALLTGEDSLIRDTARQDQKMVFGSDDRFEELLDGHIRFLATATGGQGGDYALSRSDYASSGTTVMLLAGRPHVSAKQSGLISNFDIHSVRNSAGANEQGMDFYNQDIAKVTAATLRAFKDYDLDAELLMRAFQLDSTPVRAVLAASDADPELKGKLDPRNLAFGIRGDAKKALAALQTA